MKYLSYKKTFLTGTLKGLSVQCGHLCDTRLVDLRVKGLKVATKAAPAADYGTHAQYYVTDVVVLDSDHV